MDWDQDGKLDILSGCYWTDGADAGQIQILIGKGGNNFGEAVSLENMAGKPLENVAVADGVQAEMRAICTHQHAADYDNDGDLDLIVGCFGEQFYLYENKADEENGAQSLVETPIELSIKSNSHHSAPHLADWDNDGDLDLLSGTSNGGALISENTGTAEKPDWQPFKQLVKPTSVYEQNPNDIQLAQATRVWTTDWNGDGLLDLLIGDNSTLVTPVSGMSAQEVAEGKAAIEKEMQAVSEKMEAFMPKYQAAMEKGEEPDEKTNRMMEEYSMKISEIYERKSDFETSESTGFVWLLIRKPSIESPVSNKMSKSESN